MLPAEWSWQFFGYSLLFSAATIMCFVGAMRARRIEDDETSRGLVALLATTGGWAFFELGLLVVPSTTIAYGLYELSLIIGLATVGAWLYFCSAYTGRSFHRNQLYRRTAVAVYLVIVGIKLTNPIHGLYFATEFTATPFPHLAVEHEVIHWVVSGVAYSLASVGLFMLYEMFLDANYDTRPLAVLAAATAIPVVLDITGFATDVLLDVNYEPLGVAVFAAGVLYVFKDRFFAVQLANNVDEAMVHIGPEGRIQRTSERADRAFPMLADAAGEPFGSVFPTAAEKLGETDQILEWNRGGETKYYLVNDISATLGQTDIVQSVVFTDVTETETRRQELKRHNAQLEGFAAAIRHNLLNTLQVVEARLVHADEALGDGDLEEANESLVKASEASHTMTDTVDDLSVLAREGQTVEEMQPVSFAAVARDAFAAVEKDELDLAVTQGGEIWADESRLRNILQNGFEFAAYNEAATVTVSLRDDGFEIADDGDSPDETDVEMFFQYGRAVPDADAGMILPNLEMLVRTQGWDVTVDLEYDDGFRFVVSGASTDPTAAAMHDQSVAEPADPTVR
ncbi:histidine kinase N-terminal 7TM domain-containing protein [Halorientalis sp.]|uniref:sensor histidine kinase n=1 Tax=Halorientalis sp. TaxID=1931229 RepID=UPI00260A36F8|nr:histidine kinase N-terminal 7TM domain-containing protein [Halorientalis sp.]